MLIKVYSLNDWDQKTQPESKKKKKKTTKELDLRQN